MFDALNIFLNLLCVALVVVTGDNVGEEVVEDSLVIIPLTADMETVVPTVVHQNSWRKAVREQSLSYQVWSQLIHKHHLNDLNDHASSPGSFRICPDCNFR